MLSIKILQKTGITKYIKSLVNPFTTQSIRYKVEDLNQLNQIKEEFKEYGAEGDSSVDLDLKTYKNIMKLTLNNPKRFNAFTGKMMVGLSEKITIIENIIKETQSEYIGLILTGKDNNFCSGLDLTIAKDKLTNSEAGRKLSLLMQDNLERINKLSLISVSAIEGYAMGGGAETATCTDFRIGAIDCKVSFVHRKIATVPGWGGSKRLCEILGYKKALYYLGTSQFIELPEQNSTNEFFDLVTNNNDTERRAVEFLNQFVYDNNNNQIKAENTRNIKRLITNLKTCNNQFEMLNVERDAFVSVWGSKANLDAVKQANNSSSKK